MYDTFPFLAVNAEFRLCYANNITDSSCTTYTTPRDADEKKKKKRQVLFVLVIIIASMINEMH